MFTPVSSRRQSRWIATVVAALVLLPAAWSQGNKKSNSPAGKTNTNNVKAETIKHSPLADVFAGDDGGAYYVTEKGNDVYWFAEHPGRDYAHVFHGTRDGSQIKGKYWSIPKDKATAYGSVTLKVNANGSMTRVSATGEFPSKSFSVTTIDHITKKLPGSKGHPGFTKNTLQDLDGLFVDKEQYHYYVRQIDNTVVFVAEPKFSTGTRPAGVYLFVGQRSGNGVQGDVVASTKGKAQGAKQLQLSLKPDRSLVKAGGIPFGGGPLLPVLPDIKVPIAKVMDLLNSQINKVRIRLDGYDKNGNQLKDGSFVKFGSVQKNFTLDYFEVDLGIIERRTFINDMESDIVHLSSKGPNLTRLSVIFETKGKEIKRYEKDGLGKDKIMADWQIENPRVDITFKLINHKTSSGKPSVSYEVTDVDVSGKIDAKLLTDGIENWIGKKIRPKVEKAVKELLNQDTMQRDVANALHGKLHQLSDYLDKYKLLGYSVSELAPKEVVIEGNSLVFKFN